MQALRLVTRDSPLAMWQAEFVKDQLLAIHPHLVIQIFGMKTQGDKLLNDSLSKMGGKGLFVKELEEQLLAGNADLAVHSLKDLPPHLPKGLNIGAYLAREDSRDVLVSLKSLKLHELPPQARIGTSSLRRQWQLKSLRFELETLALRGNLGTRLRKLQEGQFDAIVLAAAGLKRLGLEQQITEFFAIDTMLPSAGQGVLAIECREDDIQLQVLLQPLHHWPTAQTSRAERRLIAELNSGCQAPVAAFGQIEAEQLKLRAWVGSQTGQHIQAELTASVEEPEALGAGLAEILYQKGAATLLEDWRNHSH